MRSSRRASPAFNAATNLSTVLLTSAGLHSLTRSGCAPVADAAPTARIAATTAVPTAAIRTALRSVHPAAEPLVAEAAHLVDDGEERATLLRERVLDARRRLRVALPRHDLFRLEPAQPLGERARADPLARALELREPARALGEVVDDEHRPLRADDLGGAGDRAGRGGVDGKHRACAHELIVRPFVTRAC